MRRLRRHLGLAVWHSHPASRNGNACYPIREHANQGRNPFATECSPRNDKLERKKDIPATPSIGVQAISAELKKLEEKFGRKWKNYLGQSFLP